MITADALAGLAGIRHGFFTREGGVSTGIYASLNIGMGSADDRAAIAENRGRVAEWMGVARENLVMPHQVHSPDAVVVTAPFAAGEAPRADGLVTRVPGIALGVSSADCGPVLFADPEAGVVGACHSGWKGALTGILERTVEVMEEEGARRENITAVLGPMISAGAYEVGAEFVERFVVDDPGNTRFFTLSENAGRSMFDLPGYIIQRLTRAGLGHAENLDLCTYADEARFFSYRRMTHRGEPDYGRLVSAIALTGEPAAG